MDQKVILDVIEKQMDSLESIFNWIILLTIPVLWAGLLRKDEITAMDMTFNLQQAFYILSIAYFFTTLNIYLGFRRIGDYLILLEGENQLVGISKILLHKWSFNPFSYSGEGKANRLHNFYGYGGLIAAWWICYTALNLLLGFTFEGALNIYAMLGLFLIVGLLSMRAINRVMKITFEKLAQVDSNLCIKYLATYWDRQIGSYVGVAVGSLIYLASQLYLAFLH